METSLFVRGKESILVITFRSGLVMNTFGPGGVQARYDFADHATLDQFWQSFQESLWESGWAQRPLAERPDIDERWAMERLSEGRH